MVNWAGLEVVDYLRSGALIVAFIATVFADKKGDSSVWLTADALAGGAFGVGLYLFPTVLLDYQVSIKHDFMTDYFVRCIGASLIVSGIIWYHLSQNKDRAVTSAWLIFKVFTGFAIFTLLLTAQKGTSKDLKFKDQHLTFAVLACGLWTAGHLYHLFREDNFGSVRREGIRRDSISTNIIIDLLVVGVHALVAIGTPEHVASHFNFKVTDAHLHLLRLLFIMIFTSRLFSLQAMNFSDENNKKAFFKGILWVFLLIFPWFGLVCWKHQVLTGWRLGAQLVVFGIMLFNSMKAVGCMSCNCCGFLFPWCKRD